MNLDVLVEALPAYAKDLKLNVSSLVRNQTELTPSQLWGTVVAAAVASRNRELTQAALAEASDQAPEVVEAAKAAGAIMGMNNIYYRFTHLVSNEKYRSLPARLRMNVMRSHGASAVDFELWCTAASAINGCGACVDAHERALREKGVGEEVVAAAVRVAAVLHAVATVLDAEQAAAAASA
jgi:alkyl hydroperoxide reductase subunit D